MNRTMRAGKTVAAGVTLAAAVGVAIIASIFMRGGGTGSGAGDGTGPADGTGLGSPAAYSDPQSRPASADPAPQRPLKVTIHESSYLVDGRPVDLDQLGQLAAKVPAGSGPAVLVERDATSRSKAEEDLKAAMGQHDIKFAMD